MWKAGLVKCVPRSAGDWAIAFVFGLCFLVFIVLFVLTFNPQSNIPNPDTLRNWSAVISFLILSFYCLIMTLRHDETKLVALTLIIEHSGNQWYTGIAELGDKCDAQAESWKEAVEETHKAMLDHFSNTGPPVKQKDMWTILADR